MLDHDAPLERARSQLSIDILDTLLRGLWGKLAAVGTSPPLQDESSPHSAFREWCHRLASTRGMAGWLTVDPGSVMAPGESRVLQDDYYKAQDAQELSDRELLCNFRYTEDPS